MILQLLDHRDGVTKDMRLWGVTAVKEKRSQREFLIKDETKPKEEWRFNERAFEKAMTERTEKILEGKSDPLENFRAAHYIVQIYIFGKVRYVGQRKFPRSAAELFDSTLFHLWGFLNRPKASRFNFFLPENALTNPPKEQLDVVSLRKVLLQELRDEGTDPAPYLHNYADSIRAKQEAKAAEEKCKADEWEDMQRKHL